jgi:hypothetical protein
MAEKNGKPKDDPWDEEPLDIVEEVARPVAEVPPWGGLGPALVAFLVTQWGKGFAGRTGTMTVWYDLAGARWCSVLHNRARHVQLFRSTQTLEELLGALEKALTRDDPGWKPDRRQV